MPLILLSQKSTMWGCSWAHGGSDPLQCRPLKCMEGPTLYRRSCTTAPPSQPQHARNLRCSELWILMFWAQSWMFQNCYPFSQSIKAIFPHWIGEEWEEITGNEHGHDDRPVCALPPCVPSFWQFLLVISDSHHLLHLPPPSVPSGAIITLPAPVWCDGPDRHLVPQLPSTSVEKKSLNNP
jgi:hypothetical protein